MNVRSEYPGQYEYIQHEAGGQEQNHSSLFPVQTVEPSYHCTILAYPQPESKVAKSLVKATTTRTQAEPVRTKIFGKARSAIPSSCVATSATAIFDTALYRIDLEPSMIPFVPYPMLTVAVTRIHTRLDRRGVP